MKIKTFTTIAAVAIPMFASTTAVADNVDSGQPTRQEMTLTEYCGLGSEIVTQVFRMTMGLGPDVKELELHTMAKIIKVDFQRTIQSNGWQGSKGAIRTKGELVDLATLAYETATTNKETDEHTPVQVVAGAHHYVCMAMGWGPAIR